MKDKYAMTTYTGRNVNPLTMTAEDVDIEDIAHALSLSCRFGGHCKGFYSVAEHSVLVSRLCRDGERLDGLLHDATEAYISDVPTPLKVQWPGYVQEEARLQAVMAAKFGVGAELPESVKIADKEMFRREALELHPHIPVGTKAAVDAPDCKIQCLSAAEAKAAFLAEFAMLTS